MGTSRRHRRRPPPPSPPPSAESLLGHWKTTSNSYVTATDSLFLTIASWGIAQYHITHIDNSVSGNQFFIAQNGANNSYNPGLWSRFHWFIDSSSGVASFCQIAYNAASEAAALSFDLSTHDVTSASTGCNGFPHSVMSRYTIPVAGSWTSAHSTFTISDSTWSDVASYGTSSYAILAFTDEYAIAQNAATNSYNPNAWSKFSYHLLRSSGFSYCQSLYNAASFSDALYGPFTYNSSDASAGCSGFGHSVLTASSGR